MCWLSEVQVGAKAFVSHLYSSLEQTFIDWNVRWRQSEWKTFGKHAKYQCIGEIAVGIGVIGVKAIPLV